MPALSDVVQVNITAVTSNPTLPGFGVPLILSNSSATAGWADVVREYTTLTGGADVDFAATTAEYKAISKLFSANPRPERVLVGKGTLRPTQRWAITPVAINNYTYRMVINGTPIAFTSGGSATVTNVIAGLKAAIDALTLAVTVTDQTTFMRIVANTAGAWFSVGANDTNIGVAQDHVDPGVATDLAAINLVRSDWYGLVTLFNSQALVTAAAAWVQANGKYYVAQTQDTAVPNTAAPGTDIAAVLKAAAYDNTFVLFSGDNSDFADIALIGARFPYTPGDETWKFATLAGVTAGTYTATQRANMLAKNCNFYEGTQGVPMVTEGVSASGKYGDFVRYMNYLQSRVGTRVYGRLAAFPKVPYNDDGIGSISNEVSGQLQEDEKRGAINPGWTVSVPKLASVSQSDKSTRTLRNVVFTAVYSGAIHKVIINGSVSA